VFGFGLSGAVQAFVSKDAMQRVLGDHRTPAVAAALWRGGIAFGGVISFLFADLIALPLLLVYRKYYGGASMWRMLATFWALMSTAGLVVEGIFQLFGAVPDRAAVPEVMTTFHWNYTTVLNIVAVVVALAAVVVLLRSRSATREPVGA
jgi:uncharacterized membrane protein YraQ (UPF0718 family)